MLTGAPLVTAILPGVRTPVPPEKMAERFALLPAVMVEGVAVKEEILGAATTMMLFTPGALSSPTEFFPMHVRVRVPALPAVKVTSFPEVFVPPPLKVPPVIVHTKVQPA